MYNFDKTATHSHGNEVKKYGKFISRTLLDIAFMGEGKDSDQRRMYNTYLKKAETDQGKKKDDHSFFERQAIDSLIKNNIAN